jgi:DNA-binding SARP family transcriptional activator
LAQQRMAEGLDAYRRFRDLLSMTLGIEPSEPTRLLYAREIDASLTTHRCAQRVARSLAPDPRRADGGSRALVNGYRARLTSI